MCGSGGSVSKTGMSLRPIKKDDQRRMSYYEPQRKFAVLSRPTLIPRAALRGIAEGVTIFLRLGPPEYGELCGVASNLLFFM